MPLRYVSALTVVVCVLLSTGCHSRGSSLPIGRFVSNDDPDRILELKIDPSKTPNVFLRIGMRTGANEVFGKTIGVYHLKTGAGTSTGTFLYVKPLRSAATEDVLLNSADGTKWSIVRQADGSFRDSTGVTWHLQKPGV